MASHPSGPGAGAPARRGRRLLRLLRGPVGQAALTLAVVVAVFVGFLPRIGDYGGAWELVRSLGWAEMIGILLLALIHLVSYEPLWMAAVPGLSWWRAFLTDQVATSLSNTVPAGFALGVSTTAAMFHSFGFSPATITRAVAVTGLWNNLTKLATPVIALAGVLLVGGGTEGLAVAAAVGAALAVLAVGLTVLVLTRRRAGAVLARAAERSAGGFARAVGRPAPSGWVERVDRFRIDSRDLLRARWPWLTAAAVVNDASLFLLLLACLRSVDDSGTDVSWVLVLGVFAITRLVTAVPITPGAVGVAELSYVAGLTAIGVGSGVATGAVLLFRFLSWFLPIPTGVVTWVLWRRGAGREPEGREPQEASTGA